MFKLQVLKYSGIQKCVMGTPPSGKDETWVRVHLFTFQRLVCDDQDEIHSCANLGVSELINNFMGLLS